MRISHPCAAQVANLDAVCAGTFEPTVPELGASKNRSPVSTTGQVDFMDEKRGGCGAHSFCTQCYDDAGDLSPNCAKVLNYYQDLVESNSGGQDDFLEAKYADRWASGDIMSTTTVAMLFWADLDHWCGTANP